MAGPELNRGEIWLYDFKRPDKRRPVLVLTRPEVIPLLRTVMVAPITSTIRGVPSEIVLGVEDGMKQPCAVNLHNLVTVATAGLSRRLAQLHLHEPGVVSGRRPPGNQCHLDAPEGAAVLETGDPGEQGLVVREGVDAGCVHGADQFGVEARSG